jgi:two-component system chemotaxis response regulator CheB
MFTRLLAERLSQQCPLPVREAQQNIILEPGTVWIAPGDHHLVLTRYGAQVASRLNQNPAVNSCRPSVDVLFQSMADIYGRHCLAVVLTGMGRDGLDGCRSIHDAGGKIIVQDEESSTVWGMPRVVAEAGLADLQLPLRKIGPEIARVAGQPAPALVGA